MEVCVLTWLFKTNRNLMFSCLSTIPFELEFKIQVRFIPWLSVGTTLSGSRYAAHYTSSKHCSAAVVLQCCSSYKCWAAAQFWSVAPHSPGGRHLLRGNAGDPGKFKSSSFSCNFIVSFQDFEILIKVFRLQSPENGQF